MLTKGFKQLLAEADAAIDTITADAAVELMDDADAVFVDVREAHVPDSGRELVSGTCRAGGW